MPNFQSVPPEVEQFLDKMTQMHMAGNLQQFSQFQMAQSIPDLAKNQGAGIAAMGAGFAMGNQMMNQAQQPLPPQAAPKESRDEKVLPLKNPQAQSASKSACATLATATLKTSTKRKPSTKACENPTKNLFIEACRFMQQNIAMKFIAGSPIRFIAPQNATLRPSGPMPCRRPQARIANRSDLKNISCTSKMSAATSSATNALLKSGKTHSTATPSKPKKMPSPRASNMLISESLVVSFTQL